jgi:hypothetical protein
MKFDDLPPDAIVTDEMLEPIKEEYIIVVAHPGKDIEAITYKGGSNIEAYRQYNAIKHKDKLIAKAMVTCSGVARKSYGVDFVMGYEIIQRL